MSRRRTGTGPTQQPVRTWTEAEVRALGVRTDLVTAGEVLGIGRTKSHEMARAGEFPVRVLRLGRRYVVPVAGLLTALGLSEQSTAATDGHTRDIRPVQRQLHAAPALQPHPDLSAAREKTGGDGHAA